MDNLTDDDLFLDAVDAFVMGALEQIEDNHQARFTLFRRVLAVTQEVVAQHRPQ
jgi:hypothetical protein